jgi:hypothetical protein
MGKKSTESAGDRLKREILAVYELDPHETALLEQACGIADELARVAAALAAAPLTVTGNAGHEVAHPLFRTRAELTGRLQQLLEGLQFPGRERLNVSSSAQRAARARWRKQKAAGG